MKFIIKLMFLLMVSNLFSQISNTKTKEHYTLPGTRFAIILPDETFNNSSNYTGLYSEELEIDITITEVALPYNKVLETYEKDLPPQNGKLLIDKDFNTNGFNSKLYKTNTTYSFISNTFEGVSDSEKTINWLLIYGNENISFILSSAYKYELDKSLKEKIEKSLLSFIYLENENINPLEPFEQLDFTLDPSLVELKFATTLLQSGIVYTLDGKFPTGVKEKAEYKVMAFPFSIVNEDERKKRAINNVKSAGSEIKIKQTKKINIDGLKGYEVIGYIKKTKEDKEQEAEEKNKEKEENKFLKYGAVLFDKKKQYTIIGTSNHNFNDYLIQFQKITESVRRKIYR